MSRVLLCLLAVGLIACGGVAQADLVGLDIGGPGMVGSTTGSAGSYTITGGGNDIWGNADMFHYAYDETKVAGDFTAIAQVSPFTAGDHAWAKASIMARTDLDADSEQMSSTRSRTNGAGPQWRDDKGGGSGGTNNVLSYAQEDTIWMRLDRIGDDFYFYAAPDDGGSPAEYWVGHGISHNPSMPAEVYMGIAVTSHNNGQLATADFNSYSVGALQDPPAKAPPESIDLPPTMAGDVGVMGITEIVNNGGIGDQDAAHNSIRNGGGDIVAYQASMLNILDSGGNGHFGDDDQLAVVDAIPIDYGTVDNISMIARGVLEIPEAGDYTFGVNSDDGFTLLLPGQDFSHTGGGGGTAEYLEGVALQFYGGRGASDTLGVVNLPAGEQEFVLTWHEGGGGAAVEFFAAPGNTNFSYNDSNFRLVGDQASAGSFSVPGLAGPALVVSTAPGQDMGDMMASALAALADPFVPKTIAEYNAVNLADDTGFRWAEEQNEFPGLDPEANFNDFATAAKGAIEILEGGIYELGFTTDDGGALQIVGQEFIEIVTTANADWLIVPEGGVAPVRIEGDTLIADVWTGESFTVGSVELEAGSHDFYATAFEGGGGAHFSLFGRIQGDPNWHLLVNGGAGEYTDPSGLQLVPEPSTLAMLLGLAVLGLVCYRRRK